jgi:phosphohistidine swiveling domain-containing protein
VTLGGTSANGAIPITGNLSGTTLAGNKSDGTQWDALNTSFAKVVTDLVHKELIETLRASAIILQETQYIKAKNVKGTNKFVYTAYSDLGAADDLAEGVPPLSVAMAFDTMDFVGSQKGKIVAISDLAELYNPYEQYSLAASRIAWNIVDTMELLAATVVQAGGLTSPAAAATVAENIIANRLVLKKALVPAFNDGFYRCLTAPPSCSVLTSSRGATTRPARPTGLPPVATMRTRWPSVDSSAGRECSVLRP